MTLRQGRISLWINWDMLILKSSSVRKRTPMKEVFKNLQFGIDIYNCDI